MTYNLNSALLNLNETQSSVFLDYPLILYKIERTNVKKKQRLYFHFYYFSEKNDLKSIKLISYSNDINLEISNIFNTYNSSIYVGVVEDELEKLNKINDFVIYSFNLDHLNFFMWKIHDERLEKSLFERVYEWVCDFLANMYFWMKRNLGR